MIVASYRWVRQPDGTMIKTTSSWSSWSRSSSSSTGADEMERVRNELEQKARDRLRSVQGRSYSMQLEATQDELSKGNPRNLLKYLNFLLVH